MAQQSAPGTNESATPNNAATPVKRKKNGCLKWGAIIFAVIVVLAAISQMSGNNSPTHNGNSVSSEQSSVDAPGATDSPSNNDDVPADFKSALRRAEDYASTVHMSKQGIYTQLTSEVDQFTPEAAQYAIDNVKADWNDVALQRAKQDQETMNMSPDAIYTQLTSEVDQFAPEEAQFAVDNLNG